MNSAILGANGGLDSARALNHARNVMLNHDLSGAVLYHFVFTGSQDIAVYQAIIKSLVRRIRNHGCRLEYFGAYENDEMKGKHAHCFMLIETGKGHSPIGILNVKDGAYLHKLAVRHGINRIHLSKPKHAMHGGQFFARPAKGEKLDNCLEWIEYAYKVRSKDGIPTREKYFNSEFKSNTTKRAAAKAKRILALTPAPAALPAAPEFKSIWIKTSPALPAAKEGSISLKSEKSVPTPAPAALPAAPEVIFIKAGENSAAEATNASKQSFLDCPSKSTSGSKWSLSDCPIMSASDSEQSFPVFTGKAPFLPLGPRWKGSQVELSLEQGRKIGLANSAKTYQTNCNL